MSRLSPPSRDFSSTSEFSVGLRSQQSRHKRLTVTQNKMSMLTKAIHNAPRHLLSILDLSPIELSSLVERAHHLKHFPIAHPRNHLRGSTVAMMFNKRSTRTRVSTEAAVARMGGHSMFLGKDDIQLGVSDLVLVEDQVSNGRPR